MLLNACSISAGIKFHNYLVIKKILNTFDAYISMFLVALQANIHRYLCELCSLNVEKRICSSSQKETPIWMPQAVYFLHPL